MSRLIVISGPSGSGKGTLIARLLKSVDGVVLSVSATTRTRRPGEKHGREYFFLDEAEFERWVDEGRFLEWARYSGNMYGTPAASVQSQLTAGRDVLLEIELDGAWQVAERRPDCLMIFIMPPSLEELERRLRGRATESEESIARRMAAARREIEEVEADQGPGGRARFDYVIVNDSIDRAVEELAQAIIRTRDEDEQADDR